MLTPQTQTITPGLVRLLVKEGLLTQEAAPQHYEQSRKAGTSFVSYLIQQKLVESRNISQVISREFGIPLFDLDTLDLNYLPKGLIEEKLLIQHRALPIFKRGIAYLWR